MRVRFGFIGAEDISKAREELLERLQYTDDNLWVRRPHQGDFVKGYLYSDAEEILEAESNYSLDVFKSKEELQDFANDVGVSDEDKEEIMGILGSGKTAYLIGGEGWSSVGDDREFLIWGAIDSGRYMWHGTLHEAFETVDGWSGWGKHDDQAVETIVVWALQ